MLETCPKCGSKNARYEKSYSDLLLRCRCGYNKVVFSTLEEADPNHVEIEREVRLPRPGTHLRKTLFAVDCLEEATTAEITERLADFGASYSSSDVASYLTILRSKKLVGATVTRRGVAGGSTWILAEATTDLLEVLTKNKSMECKDHGAKFGGRSR